jgi:uncharacterized protein (UPF0262 family)
MARHPNRLLAIKLDEALAQNATPEMLQDRALAIHDLLEGNNFALSNGMAGPYRLNVASHDQRLLLSLAGEDGAPLYSIVLSLTPFRRVVKDYFQICDSYTMAVKASNPQAIEAIDMARRSIHNEGSEILQSRLHGKAEMDFDTARRLFTLVCALMTRSH